MNIGDKIQLGLIDGTVAEGTIYRITDEYIILENNNLHYDIVMIQNEHIKTITVRIGE